MMARNTHTHLEVGEGFAVIVAADELNAGEHEHCIDAGEQAATHTRDTIQTG